MTDYDKDQHIADLQARNTELVEENRRLKAQRSPLAMVREFHEKFGLAVSDRPQLADHETRLFRNGLLSEEITEYVEAHYKQNLVQMADALADMVYVIYGTALTFGIDLDRVFAEVHRSNMTKTAGGSPTKKVCKGPTYQPPLIAEVLGIEQI